MNAKDGSFYFEHATDRRGLRLNTAGMNLLFRVRALAFTRFCTVLCCDLYARTITGHCFTGRSKNHYSYYEFSGIIL
jgi:hypothetical protein